MSRGKVCDINNLIEVRFNGLTVPQLIFVQAVLVPELTYVIEKYADSILELGDCDDKTY